MSVSSEVPRLGIDLGGSKIEIAALDASGAIVHRQRTASPGNDYTAVIDCIASLVSECDAKLGQRGSIGVATPGAVSRVTGAIKNANSTCLNGRKLREDLERKLGREVRTANDANCFALSEASDGAAAGCEVVFGVILGTGVGGGIVVDGRVLTGPNAIAGEWGHNPLPMPQSGDLPLPACYCGRAGCIETWLSGPGLSRDHARHEGEALAAIEIATRAAEGNEQCDATLKRYEERLARSLAGVINILDPDAIVLGGGLSNVSRLYRTVPALWGSYIFSDEVRTRLLPPKHGDASGVRGAAWLWGTA